MTTAAPVILHPSGLLCNLVEFDRIQKAMLTSRFSTWEGHCRA